MEALLRRDWTVVVDSMEDLGQERKKKMALPSVEICVEGVFFSFFKSSTCTCLIGLVYIPSLPIVTFLSAYCRASRLDRIQGEVYLHFGQEVLQWRSWDVRWNQDVTRKTSLKYCRSLEVPGVRRYVVLLSCKLGRCSRFCLSLERHNVWLELAMRQFCRLWKG